ncbi:MAG TPA: hypothetical protein PKC20_08640 [Burkholderiaceae bacterium]|nr:hypothetical protein [Burkholderiaceae bacterium]
MTTVPTPSTRTPAGAAARAPREPRWERLVRRLGVWLRYLMTVRVQLVAALLLVATLFLPRTGLWWVVGNVFVVRPVELGLATVVALFGGWFIVQLTRVTWAGAPARVEPQRSWNRAAGAFDEQRLWLPVGSDGWTAAWPTTVREWRVQWLPAAALAAGPIGLAAVHTWNERGPDLSPLRHLVAPILGGAVAFVVVVWIFSQVHRWLRGRSPSIVKRWTVWLLRKAGPGYLDGGTVRPEQRVPLAATRLEGCIGGLCFPVLGYAVLVIMVLTAVLAGLTYLLDYWRVPTLTLVLIVAVALDRLITQDYSYRVETRTAASTQAEPLGPRAVFDAVARRWQGESARPVVITVAASGGGITSAAWTARVLTGLEQCYRDAFVRSVAVISGASGGSVGTMFYLAPPFPAVGRARDPEALQAVRAAARRSSLRAVSWGIAFPDLLKIFQLRWLAAPLEPRSAHLDRAWSLEQAWLAAWDHDLGTAGADPSVEPPMLDDWRARVRAGELPVSIFGAMTVEDGRLLLLSTGALANGGRCTGFDGRRDAITTIDCVSPKRDIAVVTGLTANAVSLRLHRAKQRLAERLETPDTPDTPVSRQESPGTGHDADEHAPRTAEEER